MIITASEIEKLFDKDTFDKYALDANSYDLTVGVKAVKGGMSTYADLSVPNGALELDPGNLAFIISREKLLLPPDVCAVIGSKRKLSYHGILLLSGEFVDPAYHGHILVGLYNLSQDPYPINKDMKICNITFHKISWDNENKPEIISDRYLLNGDFPPEIFQSTARIKPFAPAALHDQIANLRAEVEYLRDEYGNTTKLIQKLTENIDKTLSSVKEQSLNIDKLKTMVEGQEIRIEKHEDDLNDLKTIASSLKPISETWSSHQSDMKLIKNLTSLVFGAILVGVVLYLLTKFIP